MWVSARNNATLDKIAYYNELPIYVSDDDEFGKESVSSTPSKEDDGNTSDSSSTSSIGDDRKLIRSLW
jgi:hypothetical protein